jgi:hypothetical protein
LREEWRRERADRAARLEALTISNAEVRETEEGTVVEPLPMTAILERVRWKLDGWPRRVDRALFVPREGGVDWLDSASSLFGWLQRSAGTLLWRRQVGCVGKEEFFSELRRTATAYRAVESLPHEPPIENHYYACQTPPAGDGSTPPRKEPSSNKFSSCESAQEQVAIGLTNFESLSVSATGATLLELLALG